MDYIVITNNMGVFSEDTRSCQRHKKCGVNLSETQKLLSELVSSLHKTRINQVKSKENSKISTSEGKRGLF